MQKVLAIGRHATGVNHEKLHDLVHQDFLDFSKVAKEMAGYDACFFCLGVSSAEMSEQAYTQVTYDITMAAAKWLAKLNPGMTFIYISGSGTDSTEKGRFMWTRVKGKTENELMRLPFRAKYMFRPAYIQPMHGIVSKTALYRLLYSLVGWMFPLIKLIVPDYVTTTENVGRAMIRVAKQGAANPIIENRDINKLSR